MCRNYRSQLNAIELAKKDTPEVYAIYECDDRGDDLVSLVKVMERTTAIIYDVNRMGDLELFKVVPYYVGMSNRALARACGVTTRFRVKPC